MKLSLSARITNYLKSKGAWVHKSEIETFAKEQTYIRRGKVCHFLGDNSTRRLRELAEDCIIERDITREGYYRFKGNHIKISAPRIIIRDGRAVAVY